MRITITKLTDVALARTACRYTMHSQSESKMTLADLYRCEHSPIRTQIFSVEMQEIPSFVSTHFVRHSVGVSHYVQTMRDDRGARGPADRDTPVNHMMIANAQSLLNMARKRLCYKAHPSTRLLMEHITDHRRAVDPELAERMVPECLYRGWICYEQKMCGMMTGVDAAQRGVLI